MLDPSTAAHAAHHHQAVHVVGAPAPVVSAAPPEGAVAFVLLALFVLFMGVANFRVTRWLIRRAAGPSVSKEQANAMTWLYLMSRSGRD